MWHDALTAKKAALDGYRPLPATVVRNLDEWFRVELTYTSNAIEGNTLSRQETALILEKGITVSGKSVREHLEATNHATALDWTRTLITRPSSHFTESDFLHLHEIILCGIDNANAGVYRRVPVRIAGSTVVLPNYAKVPQLMQQFMQWLQTAQLHPVHLAAEAHYQLVTIHPFIDGNGRTARLLMNVLLMSAGYPPAMIRPEERLTYIQSLETAQLGGSKDSYWQVIATAVEYSLDIYLRAARGESG